MNRLRVVCSVSLSISATFASNPSPLFRVWMHTFGLNANKSHLKDDMSFLTRVLPVGVASGPHSACNNTWGIHANMKVDAWNFLSNIMPLLTNQFDSISLTLMHMFIASPGFMLKGPFLMSWIPFGTRTRSSAYNKFKHSGMVKVSLPNFPPSLKPRCMSCWTKSRRNGLTAQMTLICLFMTGCNRQSDESILQAQWAFLEWGQTAMYDLLDTLEDPDTITEIDKAFLSLCDLLPMWPLLQEFDRIRHAYPPAGPNLELRKPVSDMRVKALIEPFPDSIRDQDILLQGFVGAQPLCWPIIKGVPLLQFPDGRQALVVFHLFSGRRRNDDCHDCFHTLMPSYFPGIDILVCSIDTAVDAELCNLAQGPHLPHLLSIARQGVPALCLTGPPCETWTAARHLPAPDGSRHKWPRPLRSAKQPWGIAHRTCRELTQLATGSQLMMTSNRLELMIYLGGGGSIKEHPAEPRVPEYTSIWRTNLHKNVLLAAPGARLLYLEQWRYGAEAVKPTQLSVLGLPDAKKKLMSCTLPDVQRPVSVLQGIDENTGLFRTARAKEYPPGLCKALVTTSLSSLRKRVAEEGWSVLQSSSLGEQELNWLLAVVAAGAHCSATNFLPDYQPVPV